jgi:DNA-binding protein H-NS
MKRADFESMSVEELWALHSKVALTLARKMKEEKARLENRLRQLDRGGEAKRGVETKEGSPRRPYPKVIPKYRNPARPAETWSGRGKTPRWLSTQLKSGRKLDDFRIPSSSSRTRRTNTSKREQIKRAR